MGSMGHRCVWLWGEGELAHCQPLGGWHMPPATGWEGLCPELNQLYTSTKAHLPSSAQGLGET